VVIVNYLSPVVTLVGGASLVWEAAVAYVEPGYSAYDVMDGNITGDVQVDGLPMNVFGPLGIPSPLTYRVTDTAGNLGLAVRQVQLVDTTAPNITLLGPAVVAVEFDKKYVDAGAQAYDSYQGNITNLIVIDNPVNTSALPGTRFNVTFNVRDASNNSATPVLREVMVIPVESSASAAPMSVMAVGPIAFVIVLIFIVAVLLYRRKRQYRKQVGSSASAHFDSSIGIENSLYSSAMVGATGRVDPGRTSLGVDNSLYAHQPKVSFAANPLHRSKSSSAYEHVEEESLYSQPTTRDNGDCLQLTNLDAWSESIVETSLDFRGSAQERFFQSSHNRTSLADRDGLYEPLPDVSSTGPHAGHDDDFDDHYQHIRLASSEAEFPDHMLASSDPPADERFGFHDMTVAPNKDNGYITAVTPQNPNGYMTISKLPNDGAYMTIRPQQEKNDQYVAVGPVATVVASERGLSDIADEGSQAESSSVASGYIMVEPGDEENGVLPPE